MIAHDRRSAIDFLDGEGRGGPLREEERREIPDDEVLLRQLRMLERRRGSSGRDRVDHPRGGHDDRANVLAGVAAKILAQPTSWGFDELFKSQLDGEGDYSGGGDDDEYVYNAPRRGLA